VRKIFLSCLSVFILSVAAIAATEEKAFDKSIPAEVIENKAFIRATHNHQSKRIVTLEEGDALELLSEWKGPDNDSWYKIKTDEGEGWIYGQVIRRLDRKQEDETIVGQKQKPVLPESRILAGNKDYVTVIASGQGMERAQALEQAWIEAVRLAVGTIISSKSLLNNDEFVENIIAHSRGVIETFDIIGEREENNHIYIAIQAKVHKEILLDTAKIYSGAQTVKALPGEAIKAQLDTKAQDNTSAAKQDSAVALLRELLEGYTPEMFYSATLDPQIYFNKEQKKPYLNIVQKFDESRFWKEFLPKLHTALNGVAVKKEKKFYTDTVRQANQKLAKERYAAWLGTYSPHISHNREIYGKNVKETIPLNVLAPYSWGDEAKGDNVVTHSPSLTYPRGGFLRGWGRGGWDQPAALTAIVPENNSTYVVYYLPCEVGYEYAGGKVMPQNPSNEQLYSLFMDYMEKMAASVAFSVSFLDQEGNEFYTQAWQIGARMLTIYRSFFFEGNQYHQIPEAVTFAPGYIGGTKTHLFLDSTSYFMEYYIELENEELSQIGSMKFEIIFDNS
jgi:hypothetical protein